MSTDEPFYSPKRTLPINDVSVTEGDTGSVNATFTVSLSPASTPTVTVNYATAYDSATAGSDYPASSGSVSFAPGVATRTLTLPLCSTTRSTEANGINERSPGTP